MQIEYAGFWPRFGAMLLDLVIFLPLIVLNLWGERHFRLYYAYIFLPNLLVSIFFSIYLVRRFGGTPGKRLMRLRITRLSGEPVGYREAIIRYLPELLIGALASLAIIIPSVGMSDAEYLSLAQPERYLLLRERAPSWSGIVQVVSQLWFWSEFLVLLTNTKRRALHDFIAGTVVIREPAKIAFPQPQTREVSPTPT